MGQSSNFGLRPVTIRPLAMKIHAPAGTFESLAYRRRPHCYSASVNGSSEGDVHVKECDSFARNGPSELDNTELVQLS